MKSFLKYFFGMFAVVNMSGCANGKKLHEEAPVAFRPAYYTIHLAQDDSNDSRMNFYLPTEDFLQKEVQLDSVYFRSRKAALVAEGEGSNLYVAYFDLPGKDEDFVMHVDLRKEYGNKVPVLENIPFDLKADEAVVVYSKNGETGYYKLQGVKEKGSDQDK